jgi:hypothetical protein
VVYSQADVYKDHDSEPALSNRNRSKTSCAAGDTQARRRSGAASHTRPPMPRTARGIRRLCQIAMFAEATIGEHQR